MRKVVTLTPSPAIDVCASVNEVMPARKLRCSNVRRDPGGGGINVARVIQRLGGDVTAIYPAGGSIGELLNRLVERERIHRVAVRIDSETREDLTIDEGKLDRQYRFVFPGAALREPEWQACLDALLGIEPAPNFVVGSGSLPPGAPDDFYARAGRLARNLGAKMLIDTSGSPLQAALEEGVYLVKPSLRELRELTRAPLAHQGAWIEACRGLIDARRTEIVALTLGSQGALLVTANEVYRALPIDIHAVSTVGAGDSFLGGMLWALACGHGLPEAFRYGSAAGSAAVMSHGTELCHAGDVVRLHQQAVVEHISYDHSAASDFHQVTNTSQ